ncbi:MAG: hypothetical protein V7L20_32080 [Nostoc sp.]|uniref:hypothetical protein n=1 Tax=Nostoc sp. TaxID=1180 RepID=UPI002FF4FDA3
MEAITASAIATLVFNKAFETTIEKFTEAALVKIAELRKKIWEKLKGNSQAATAFVEADKGSKPDVDKVAAYLQRILRDEPEFAKEVQTLAREIQAGKIVDNSNMTQINHDNAKGWQTKVEGGTVYQGEINIHHAPPNS